MVIIVRASRRKRKTLQSGSMVLLPQQSLGTFPFLSSVYPIPFMSKLFINYTYLQGKN